MKKNIWIQFVDLVTIFWLIAFVYGLITVDESVRKYCEYVMFGLLPVFICDLAYVFRQEDSFRSFIKNRWFDILLVIPYFRIFRVLRFAKLLRVLKAIRMKRALNLTRLAKKSQRVVGNER